MIISGSFTTLIIAALAIIVIAPFAEGYVVAEWLIEMMIIPLLAAIVFTCSENRTLMITAIILSLSAIIFYNINLFHSNIVYFTIQQILLSAVYLIAIIIIFREFINSPTANLNTIFAGLSVYLLLGLLFGSIYILIEVIYPHSFRFHGVECPFCTINQFNLYYFSFTTLTTVGFGEIIPITPYSRSFVIIEQMSGVIYLAAVISRMVANIKK